MLISLRDPPILKELRSQKLSIKSKLSYDKISNMYLVVYKKMKNCSKYD
jgi:hypothetical protein